MCSSARACTHKHGHLVILSNKKEWPSGAWDMNISRLVELGMESQSLEMLKKEDCNQPGFHRETLSQNKIKKQLST